MPFRLQSVCVRSCAKESSKSESKTDLNTYARASRHASFTYTVQRRACICVRVLPFCYTYTYIRMRVHTLRMYLCSAFEPQGSAALRNIVTTQSFVPSRFKADLFWKNLIYHVLAPFTIPFICCIEGMTVMTAASCRTGRICVRVMLEFCLTVLFVVGSPWLGLAPV